MREWLKLRQLRMTLFNSVRAVATKVAESLKSATSLTAPPLFGRYAMTFRSAWERRHTMDATPRPPHELEFLPAHLELINTPVHPAPAWTLRAIVIFASVALTWSIFGKLDIVAVAHGKIIPSGKSKEIQSLETANVRRILVKNGDVVKRGSVLIELDDEGALSELGKATTAEMDARLTIARVQAVLAARGTHAALDISGLRDVEATRLAAAQQLADAQLLERQKKADAQQKELEKRTIEMSTTHRELESLASTSKIAQESADSYQSLLAGQFVSRQEFLDKQQAFLEQRGQLKTLESRLGEQSAAIGTQRSTIEAEAEQFRRERLDELTQAQQQLAQALQDERKARDRVSHMVLRSPVDGVVTNLNVNTVGGVVTAANTLMEIVPPTAIEVEATLENQDIGFVRLDQPAVVKVDAFPYTRYGLIDGKVEYVADDSVADKQGHHNYTIRVALLEKSLDVDGRRVALSPGMSVSVEIKTGRRTVARYLLDPILRYKHESLAER